MGSKAGGEPVASGVRVDRVAARAFFLMSRAGGDCTPYLHDAHALKHGLLACAHHHLQGAQPPAWQHGRCGSLRSAGVLADACRPMSGPPDLRRAARACGRRAAP